MIEPLHDDRLSLALLRIRLAESEALNSRHALSSGGSGGTYGGMEARVAKLESDVAHLVSDVKDLRADVKDIHKTTWDARERLRGLEVKVDHLPSKGFIVSAVTTTLALITAAVVFQAQLQELFGLLHRAH